MGLLGAMIMGSVVYWVNADHGFWAAIPAALKQATYTAVAGGFLSRFCEKTAIKFDNKTKSIILGTILPTILAVTMTYGVHILRGTPEPVNSTIPTMVLAPWSFLWWAMRMRNINDRNKDCDTAADQADQPPVLPADNSL